MKTESIHLIFIAGLALALGFSLSSSPAIGYPASAVSYGNNPLWATGGQATGMSTTTVFTAPTEHDAVATDIAIDVDNYAYLTLRLSGGDVVGMHYVFASGQGHRDRSLLSGINIPAGQSLQLEVTSGSTVFYSVSGYYARP